MTRNDFQVHADALGDLMKMLGDFCPVIGWNNSTYRAIPSGSRTASDNSAGGYSLDASLTLTFLVEDFGTDSFPDSTEIITYPAGVKEYKIVSVTVMAGQKTGRMALEDSNQAL